MSDEEATAPSEEQLEQPESTSPEDYKEKWQRALADLENSRKRFDQEKSNLLKYGIESLVEELLPVIDNFDRATSHIPEEQKKSSWVTGIQYIQKNLLDVLEQRGLEEVPTKPGDHFDSSKHEAIATVESDAKEDTIVEVQAKGYALNGRLIRPARVTVSQSKD